MDAVQRANSGHPGMMYRNPGAKMSPPPGAPAAEWMNVSLVQFAVQLLERQHDQVVFVLHALRSACLLCSLVGYFHALTQLPLALAVTISYLAPIFVAVLSVPVLKEKPSGAIWLALGAGLTGVSLSVWPELSSGLAAVSGARLLGMAEFEQLLDAPAYDLLVKNS